jgi:exodeoxyribonuclease-3
MKVVTWNVNGIRASIGKGFIDYVVKTKPDVLCLQEIKAKADQIPVEAREIKGYHSFFFPAQKPGYSGTAIYTKVKPDEIWQGLDAKLSPEATHEGRVLAARYGNLHILSCYFINSQDGGKRQSQKIAFFNAVTKKAADLVKKGQQVLVTGDFNVAHNEIDLARPDDNHENPGFFPWERQAMTDFLKAGFSDIYREKNPSLKDAYTWWSFRTAARARNVGWRIDYTCVDNALKARVKKTWIEHLVMGSDHCPVGIELK